MNPTGPNDALINFLAGKLTQLIATSCTTKGMAEDIIAAVDAHRAAQSSLTSDDADWIEEVYREGFADGWGEAKGLRVKPESALAEGWAASEAKVEMAKLDGGAA